MGRRSHHSGREHGGLLRYVRRQPVRQKYRGVHDGRSGSEQAGSVAELPWTEEGIIATLEEVPNEKLVLGMPFYSRLWKEGTNGLETKAYSMSSIAELIAQWGEQPTLDEVSGQNYVEHEQDGELYKVWIEDYESIHKRIALMEKYKLAGYAAWRLGYETDDIWDILSSIE